MLNKITLLFLISLGATYGQTVNPGGGGGGSSPSVCPGSSSGTTNAVLTDTGAGACQDSLASVAPTTGNFTTSGTAATGVGGTLSGMVSWSPNTSQPSIPANAFSIVAPTTYTQQLAVTPPNALPSAHSVMIFPAPTSNDAVWAWKVISDCQDSGGNHLNYTQSTDAWSCGTSTSAPTQIYKFGASFGAPSSGTALTTTMVGYSTPAPAACTITHWSITVDSGTATVQFMKVASGTALPTHGSNNINTAGVSIASGTVVDRSATLTDFTTTSVAAGDIVGVYLTTLSGPDYLAAEFECQ